MLPTPEYRKEYLKGVMKHRGRDNMLKLHKAAHEIRLALRHGAQ